MWLHWTGFGRSSDRVSSSMCEGAIYLYHVVSVVVGSQVSSPTKREWQQVEVGWSGILASEADLHRRHGAAICLLHTTLQPAAEIPRCEGKTAAQLVRILHVNLLKHRTPMCTSVGSSQSQHQQHTSWATSAESHTRPCCRWSDCCSTTIALCLLCLQWRHSSWTTLSEYDVHVDSLPLPSRRH